MSLSLNGYETTFITDTDISDTNFKNLKSKITNIIESSKGSIVLTEDWGKKKFAYPIQKQVRGQYTYLVYLASPNVIAELERTLKLHDHVLRFLTVKLDENFNAEEFSKKRQNYHLNVKRREDQKELKRDQRDEFDEHNLDK